jgi:hypothetical protein
MTKSHGGDTNKNLLKQRERRQMHQTVYEFAKKVMKFANHIKSQQSYPRMQSGADNPW